MTRDEADAAAVIHERGTGSLELIPHPERSLTTFDVDDELAAKRAAQLLKHRGGLFPQDMTEGQATALARLASVYSLDIFAGELILFQGHPYLTIDGRMRIANTHPAFDGLECLPATEDERKAFRCGEDEHLWKATVWRRDRRVPMVAYGRASGHDGNPVSTKWAQEMAQKRAKHRALRDAFSIPLPGAEESPAEGGAAYAVDEGLPTSGVIEGDALVVDFDAPNPIRADQVKAVHVLVGKLKWTDDAYRAMLRHTYGVSSSKELLEGQAASLLEMLHTLEEQKTGDAFIAQVREVALGRTEMDLAPSDAYESEPSLRPEHGVTAAQVAEITRLAPQWADGADWDSMSEEAAALMLTSLRERKR